MTKKWILFLLVAAFMGVGVYAFLEQMVPEVLAVVGGTSAGTLLIFVAVRNLRNHCSKEN